MRRLTIFLSILSITGCSAQRTAVRSIGELQKAPLFTFNERELDAFLRAGCNEDDSLPKRVVALARKTIGQPYKLFVLGEFPFELIDADPLYCLSASDCVTFVEQTYAIALAKDWPSFFHTLQRIRYKDGQIGIVHRNHFTEADWNINNAWLFDDVTDKLMVGVAQPMRSRIDRAAFFKRLGIDSQVLVQILETQYIPSSQLKSVLPALRDGDLVEFVSAGGEWKSVTHLGLIAHDAARQVTLLHSGKPAVHELPLEQYVAKHPAFVGVKVLRARVQAQAN